MALIGHGHKVPRKITIATRLDRQIRADVPVPDPRQKASQESTKNYQTPKNYNMQGRKPEYTASGKHKLKWAGIKVSAQERKQVPAFSG